MRRRFYTLKNSNNFNYADYLTFEVLSDTAVITMRRKVYYIINGDTWLRSQSSIDEYKIEASKGDLVSLSCVLAAGDTFGAIYIEGDVNLRGNSLSIIFGDEAKHHTDISAYPRVFDRLFASAESSIHNIEKDFLPATTLAEYCYADMFQNCDQLVEAPTLPATTLADGCYSSMFSYCTSLTTAPALPATTLASDCYGSMFTHCTSLTTAPVLPATTLASDCYSQMFSYCTSLTTAPALPATALAPYCYSYMFSHCTSLKYIKMLATGISATNCLYRWVNGVASTGTFVKNPAMTRLPTGADGIPSGWTVINDSESSATANYLTIYALEDGLTASLSTNACEYCVDGDGNWKSLAAGTATESINAGQTLSFRGNLTPISGAGIGTFTITKRCNLLGNCMSMLFGDNAADNHSLSGKEGAFNKLFYNCTNIINVSDNFLPATTLAHSCYIQMFYGCTSLIHAPELPATKLTKFCYYYMFYGCTSLVNAPVLPAITLTSHCYAYMFRDCTKLNYIKMLATDISADYCLHYWAVSTSSTGTFVKNPSMTSLPTATGFNYYSGVPEGWTVINNV